MRRRTCGFTLVEVMVCLAVISAVSFPFIMMVVNVNRNYHAAIRFNDMKAELDRGGFRILALLRKNPGVRIGSRNRSLTWREQIVTEDGKNLVLSSGDRSYVLLHNLTHFSVYRRDGSVIYTLEIEDPQTGRRRRSQYVWRADEK